MPSRFKRFSPCVVRLALRTMSIMLDWFSSIMLRRQTTKPRNWEVLNKFKGINWKEGIFSDVQIITARRQAGLRFKECKYHLQLKKQFSIFKELLSISFAWMKWNHKNKTKRLCLPHTYIQTTWIESVNLFISNIWISVLITIWRISKDCNLEKFCLKLNNIRSLLFFACKLLILLGEIFLVDYS